MNRDLTVGKPSTVLWKYCLPLFGSVIFQQLYNIADSFTVGKFIGDNALAAVGNSYEITLVFIAFAFGCSVGCSVIVSRFFGSGNLKDMKTAVSTSLIASGAVCALLMTLGYVFCDDLLRLINTPENILADSAGYLDIYIYSLPFVFFYNIATGIFSALGDSKTPFFFLAASSLSNIAADILFVTVFDMGIPGVAWATFICQGISCILSLIFVRKRLLKITVTGKIPLFSFGIFRMIAAIAVPSIIQQSFVSVGNVIVQSIVNIFGASVIAGFSAATKLNSLAVTSYVTVSNGISNYTSQNLGAGKPERIRQGFSAGMKMVWLIALPFCFIYFFAGRYLSLIFISDPDGTAMQTSAEFLRWVSPFYFFVAAKLVSDSIMRGTGRMRQFMTSTFADLILRVLLSYVLAVTLKFGITGVFISWPIGWVISSIISILFYRKDKNSL